MKNLLLVLIIAVFTACGSSNGGDGTTANVEETMEMLESVFEGPYSKWAIKDKLDTVLELYDMELVQENYLKIGNALVALRKESNGSFIEMDIVNDMINANSGEQGVSFNSQLNNSVRTLQKNLATKE